MVPLGVAGRGLEQPLAFVGRQRPAHGLAARFGQHLHVVLEPPPLLEPLEHLAQHAHVHVDGAVADALETALGLEALDDLPRDGGELDVAEMPLLRREEMSEWLKEHAWK